MLERPRRGKISAAERRCTATVLLLALLAVFHISTPSVYARPFDAKKRRIEYEAFLKKELNIGTNKKGDDEYICKTCNWPVRLVEITDPNTSEQYNTNSNRWLAHVEHHHKGNPKAFEYNDALFTENYMNAIYMTDAKDEEILLYYCPLCHPEGPPDITVNYLRNIRAGTNTANGTNVFKSRKLTFRWLKGHWSYRKHEGLPRLVEIIKEKRKEMKDEQDKIEMEEKMVKLRTEDAPKYNFIERQPIQVGGVNYVQLACRTCVERYEGDNKAKWQQPPPAVSESLENATMEEQQQEDANGKGATYANSAAAAAAAAGAAVEKLPRGRKRKREEEGQGAQMVESENKVVTVDDVPTDAYDSVFDNAEDCQRFYREASQKMNLHFIGHQRSEVVEEFVIVKNGFVKLMDEEPDSEGKRWAYCVPCEERAITEVFEYEGKDLKAAVNNHYRKVAHFPGAVERFLAVIANKPKMEVISYEEIFHEIFDSEKKNEEANQTYGPRMKLDEDGNPSYIPCPACRAEIEVKNNYGVADHKKFVIDFTRHFKKEHYNDQCTLNKAVQFVGSHMLDWEHRNFRMKAKKIKCDQEATACGAASNDDEIEFLVGEETKTRRTFRVHQHVLVSPWVIFKSSSGGGRRRSKLGSQPLVATISAITSSCDATDKEHMVQDSSDMRWKQVTVAFVDYVVENSSTGEIVRIRYDPARTRLLHVEEIQKLRPVLPTADREQTAPVTTPLGRQFSVGQLVNVPHRVPPDSRSEYGQGRLASIRQISAGAISKRVTVWWVDQLVKKEKEENGSEAAGKDGEKEKEAPTLVRFNLALHPPYTLSDDEFRRMLPWPGAILHSN